MGVETEGRQALLQDRADRGTKPGASCNVLVRDHLSTVRMCASCTVRYFCLKSLCHGKTRVLAWCLPRGVHGYFYGVAVDECVSRCTLPHAARADDVGRFWCHSTAPSQVHKCTAAKRAISGAVLGFKTSPLPRAAPIVKHQLAELLDVLGAPPPPASLPDNGSAPAS